MSEQYRIVERLTDDDWYVVMMEELEAGDIFRLRDSTSSPPEGPYVAVTDAYVGDSGYWQVDVSVSDEYKD